MLLQGVWSGATRGFVRKFRTRPGRTPRGENSSSIWALIPVRDLENRSPERNLSKALVLVPYRSSSEEPSDGGQFFASPRSSTTRDFEPGGKTCRDFKNSMRLFCWSGGRASNANRWESASPL